MEKAKPALWDIKKVSAAAHMGPIKAVALPEKVNNPNPKPWVSFGIRLAITTLLELCRGPAKKVPATTNTIYALGFLLMEISTTMKERISRVIIIVFLSFLALAPNK